MATRLAQTRRNLPTFPDIKYPNEAGGGTAEKLTMGGNLGFISFVLPTSAQHPWLAQQAQSILKPSLSRAVDRSPAARIGCERKRIARFRADSHMTRRFSRVA